MDADGASAYTLNKALSYMGLPRMCHYAIVNQRHREVTFYLRRGSPELTRAQKAQLTRLIGARAIKATPAWIVGRW